MFSSVHIFSHKEEYQLLLLRKSNPELKQILLSHIISALEQILYLTIFAAAIFPIFIRNMPPRTKSLDFQPYKPHRRGSVADVSFSLYKPQRRGSIDSQGDANNHCLSLLEHFPISQVTSAQHVSSPEDCDHVGRETWTEATYIETTSPSPPVRRKSIAFDNQSTALEDKKHSRSKTSSQEMNSTKLPPVKPQRRDSILHYAGSLTGSNKLSLYQ